MGKVTKVKVCFYIAQYPRSEQHIQIQSQTNAHPHHIHPTLCLRDLDDNNRITEEDQSRGNEMLPPPFAHFIQRPHHKWNSVQENTNSHRSLRRYINNCEKRKLRWFGHVIRSSGLCKKVLQGTVPGKRKRGRQKKRWEDNIREWTGLDFNSSQRAAEDREMADREMAEDCRRCQQWCHYDPDGSGTQVTGKYPVHWTAQSAL